MMRNENMKDVWKDIKGYEGLYQVSNLGRIKSLAKIRPCNKGVKINRERILSLFPDKKGYLMTFLYDLERKRKTLKVHRLVANAFIPNPDNKPQIDHINAVKSDNRVCNLRWCTSRENFHNPISYARNSVSKTGYKNHKAKSVSQYTLDDKFIRTWLCISDIRRELGYDHSHITQCCRGERKLAYGYKWRYAEL